MDASSHADAERPVQGQLDAYNARDIDAFMRWWAEDCRYYEFPDRLLADGAAEVRERHVARFEEPNLHGRLVNRIAAAGMVVDQETVTRTFPDGPGEVDVVAIYEVEDGRIARAWFKVGTPRLFARGSEAVDTGLRRAAAADAAAVHGLTRAAYAKWVPVIGREPRPMAADPEARVRDHLVDLLHVGGALAALVETVPEEGVLLVENVAVLPAFQGRGLGRRLMAHAEALAASLNLPRVRLYTNALFAENVALYRGLGYAVDREEPFINGTAVHMSKPVRPPEPGPACRQAGWAAARSTGGDAREEATMPRYRLHCFPESGSSYKLALMLAPCGQAWKPV